MLLAKLEESEKAIKDANSFKQDLETSLNQSTKELDDFRQKQSLENEDKSKRMQLLQQELKDLQEKSSQTNN